MKKYYLLLVGIFLSSCSVISTNPTGIGTTPNFSDLTPKSDYVIYYDNATLPTLYSAVNMMTHNKPSFMYMERIATLDETKMPAYVTMISSDEEMRVKIADLNRNKPNATFTFYVNDQRFARVLNFFYRQGIARERVRVVQISDGTLTYTKWKQEFSGTGAMSVWDRLKIFFNKEMAKEHHSTEQIDPEDFANNGMSYPPATEFSLFELWMQWPELLVSDSTDLRNYLQENAKRYYKVDPLGYFRSLSSMQRDSFLALVGLDKKWALNEGAGTLNNQTIGEAFNASSKPNVIITGSNPYSNGDRDMDALIAEAKAFYGNGYDYFFKGHPADTTHPSDNSIVVLPFRLPMEAIIWAYGDRIDVIGGIESSLYMNAPKETKKFFFNEKSDGSTLLSPLDLMYKQGLLGDVKFF